MSGSGEHPARILFDCNFVPGLLQRIVLEEHSKSPEIVEYVETVKSVYEWADCHNVVLLIEHLVAKDADGMGISVIGSGSIDIAGLINEASTLADAQQLQELYLGIVVLSIDPIGWLTYLSRGFDQVPIELRPSFDLVCESFLAFDRAIADGSAITSMDEPDLVQPSIQELLDETFPETKH